MKKRYFVTGIGTGIGKTLISAVLVEALEADYWKPIQAGDLAQSDSHTVASLVDSVLIHPEAVRLKYAMSPHAAAEREGREVRIAEIHLPKTDNNLIIEGAGGLLVPLNKNELIIDLIQKLGAEVILVSQNYLGSINHTLLSYEALQSRQIPIAGLVFNGPSNPETEEFILNHTKLRLLGNISEEPHFGKEEVKRYARSIRVKIRTLEH